jgi:ribose-phosphate pyrophosphokinase
MENQIQCTNNIQKSPIAPIGLVAPPGGKALSKLINQHLVKYRMELIQEFPGYTSYSGFSRPNFEIECSCPRFASGEGKAILHESIRDYDVFIISDIENYGCKFKIYGIESPMSPDDHFQDIKRIISVIGDRAHRITVIMPYLYEGRQHQRKLRESLDCALALRELENLGVNNIVTFDAHDTRVQNAIPLIDFENLHATYQIIKALLQTEQDLIVDREHLMVVSPDEGAVERCLYYASNLGVDMSLFYKRRDTTRVVDGKNPIIDYILLESGEIKGKDILLVDDMLASGDSILLVANKLRQRQCGHIFVVVAFALFTEGLEKYHQAYQDGIISRVYATNLTYRTPELLNSPWFVDVDVSEFVAYFIDCLNRSESISALLDNSAKIAKLLKARKKNRNNHKA